MGNIRIFRFASAFPGALVHERVTKSEEQEAVVANMELAISLAQPAALARIGSGPEAREAYWRERHGDPYLAAWLARFTPTHFYQGSEFCEHLLPSPHALKTGLQRARECRMRFCLLTPVASPQVIRNLALLLPLLPADAEVVANDWGVVRFIRENHPSLRTIAGRILCRMIKDPRLPGRDWAMHCGFDFAPLRTLFELCGLRHMEIDTPLFADTEAFAALPLRKSVHLPYFYVAKGRMCRIGALAQSGPERFAVGRKCKKECLTLSARIERAERDDQWCSWQIGNTMFGRYSQEMLEAVIAAVDKGYVDRLVMAGDAA
ncbi:hypothetical protein [Pseudomonas jinjuensis]|nr:hypothetical protein [Pseudomonas jinjuensis]